jgi:RNA-directed DNA polymerase
LQRLIRKCGFELNSEKTRMQYCDSRQEVTGLVVNRRISVPKEYRYTVRAMVHRLFSKGAFSIKHKTKNADREIIVIESVGETTKLQGMLAYIEQVDEYNRQIKTKDEHNLKASNSRELLYRRFLFFNTFYDAKSPVIICEGKTDNIYIVHAIRSLAAKYPKLATKNESGIIKLNVRIFKYFDTSTGRILGMHGGVAGLVKFMNLYHDDVKKRFKAPGALQPIIMLIDNDEGSKAVFAAVKKITNKSLSKSDPFIHVTSNLYVVPTPLKSEENSSMIEDFFDDATRNITVDSKKFNPKNELDTSSEYGKAVFAHKVVTVRAESIDFGGFTSLLDNLASAIEFHASRHVISSEVSQIASQL